MKTRTYVCGLDVHKDSIYAAIYDGKARSEVQIFGTFTQHIKEPMAWLQENK